MDLRLDGKVAIVTGGSRGIGFACAAELLREGASTVILSRDSDRNTAATQILASTAGERVLGITADLRERAEGERSKIHSGMPMRWWSRSIRPATWCAT